MKFKPDYLCPNGCVAQDALAEQLEARKADLDEIEELKKDIAAAIKDGKFMRIGWKKQERQIKQLQSMLKDVFNTYLDQCAMSPDSKLCARVQALLADVGK